MKNGTLEEVTKRLRPRHVAEKRGGPRGKKDTRPRQPALPSETVMSASMPEDSQLRMKLEEAVKAGDVTTLLQYWPHEVAFNEIYRLLLPELRRIAKAQMRHESDKRDVQTTLLINDALLKLCPQQGWNDRGHFLRFARKVMRQVAIGIRRKQSADKRGGGLPPSPLNENDLPRMDHTLEVLVVDELLDELAKTEPDAARAFEDRYFGGLAYEEIATSLKVSTNRARSLFAFARGWMVKRYVDELLDELEKVNPEAAVVARL